MKFEVFTTVNFGIKFFLAVTLQSSILEPTHLTWLPHHVALLTRWPWTQL